MSEKSEQSNCVWSQSNICPELRAIVSAISYSEKRPIRIEFSIKRRSCRLVRIPLFAAMSVVWWCKESGGDCSSEMARNLAKTTTALTEALTVWGLYVWSLRPLASRGCMRRAGNGSVLTTSLPSLPLFNGCLSALALILRFYCRLFKALQGFGPIIMLTYCYPHEPVCNLRSSAASLLSIQRSHLVTSLFVWSLRCFCPLALLFTSFAFMWLFCVNILSYTGTVCLVCKACYYDYYYYYHYIHAPQEQLWFISGDTSFLCSAYQS